MVRSEDWRLYSPAKMHRNSSAWHEYTAMHEVLLLNGIFNRMTKGRWYEIEKLTLEFKAYWSFRMTSDVACLETSKNIYTMHFVQRGETWINLKLTSISRLCWHSYRTENLSGTQLRLGSTFSFWVNRFHSGKANRQGYPTSIFGKYLFGRRFEI